MRAHTHAKSQAVGIVEQITGLGVKVGVPLLVLVVCHLLYSAFSSNMRHLAQMSEQERGQFVYAVNTSVRVATISAYVVAASLIIRLFREEALGQALAIVGAALYFGSPPLFAALAVGEQVEGNELFTLIVNEFRTLGMIGFVPGLVLVVRDAILRILLRFADGGTEEGRDKDRDTQPSRFYGSCRDIQRCTESLRRLCPAWKAGKSCWRIKSGCLCEGYAWQHPESAGNRTADGTQALQHAPRRLNLSPAEKRQRCRDCNIYIEHQRQKFRIVSVLVFPAAGVILYMVYGPLSRLIYTALEKVDRSLSFLSYRGGSADSSFSGDGHIVTAMAVVWLAIIGVSYAQKLVEYLVFERKL